MINTALIIIEQSLLHLPLTLGAYISFSLLKVPDLSIESAYVMGAIFGGRALNNACSFPTLSLIILPLLSSLIGGAVVGCTSGMLTKSAGFPPLLSSIITSGIFHGIAQLLSLSYVSLNNVAWLDTAPYFELALLATTCSLLALLVFYLLRSQIGYALAVYGNNPYFFKHYHISTTFTFITGIALANALSGIAGYLFAQSNRFIELNMGLGRALMCITILILGKSASGNAHPFSIIVPLMGTGMYFTLQQLLLKASFNMQYLPAVQAIVVLFILLCSGKLRHVDNDSLGL